MTATEVINFKMDSDEIERTAKNWHAENKSKLTAQIIKDAITMFNNNKKFGDHDAMVRVNKFLENYHIKPACNIKILEYVRDNIMRIGF